MIIGRLQIRWLSPQHRDFQRGMEATRKRLAYVPTVPQGTGTKRPR